MRRLILAACLLTACNARTLCGQSAECDPSREPVYAFEPGQYTTSAEDIPESVRDGYGEPGPGEITLELTEMLATLTYENTAGQEVEVIIDLGPRGTR